MTTPRIQAALDELIAAIQEDTVTSFQALLTGKATSGGRRATASRAASAPARARGRAKGAKRSADEIETQSKAFLAAVKKKPGRGMEEISKEIGVATKELQLPVAKLWESKAIRTTGVRRATKYFPK